MREKTVESKAKQYLSKIGAYHVKIHGSSFQEPGIPDIIACYRGWFLGIEMKAPGKLSTQSEQQKIHQRNIERAGGLYILADDVETIKNVIRGIDEEYTNCK